MSAWTELRDSAKSRIEVVIVGCLFWIVFGIGTIITLIAQALGIIVYAVTGNTKVRDWVTETGQGTDALNNAALFGGDFRETISSHTGRWFTAKYGNTYLKIAAVDPDLVIPWKFRFVKWLTDKFQPDHVLLSIEEPFLNEPL